MFGKTMHLNSSN